MSIHANFHRVTSCEIGNAEPLGGTESCPSTFYSRRIAIVAEGVRHEFNLFAESPELLAIQTPACVWPACSTTGALDGECGRDACPDVDQSAMRSAAE